MVDIEKIQIPFPTEEAVEKVEELTNQLSENVESSMDVKGKSGDIYGGLSMEYMVSTWGLEKTLEYLEATADLYKTMGMLEESKKISKQRRKLKVSTLKANMESLKETKKKNAEKFSKEINNRLTTNTKRAYAKADELEQKLSSFTEERRKNLQATIRVIEALPNQEELEKFIIEQFDDKVFSKVTKKVEEKMKPIEEDIKPWLELLLAIYEMGKSISIDTVVKIVKQLITLQFYPFIIKYNQYNNTLKDLRALTLEVNLIVDAINRKASEFDAPINIVAPPIPELPVLPDLPV